MEKVKEVADTSHTLDYMGVEASTAQKYVIYRYIRHAQFKCYTIKDFEDAVAGYTSRPKEIEFKSECGLGIPLDEFATAYRVHTSPTVKSNQVKLCDKNSKVYDGDIIGLYFDTPFKTTFVVYVDVPVIGEGFTREELLNTVKHIYALAYHLEDNTSQNDARRMKDVCSNCSLENRCQTTGVFGIYGHFISDLSLHNATYVQSPMSYMIMVDT